MVRDSELSGGRLEIWRESRVESWGKGVYVERVEDVI